MMDFMDAFVDSSNAARGFAITYDLRALRSPSINMVMRVAEWGGHPEREAKWKELNRACKVVVNAGLRFTMCRGVLTTFFFVCPPIVRTYLLTDPDQPEEEAVVFEAPVPEAGEAPRAPLDGAAVEEQSGPSVAEPSSALHAVGVSAHSALRSSEANEGLPRGWVRQVLATGVAPAPTAPPQPCQLLPAEQSGAEKPSEEKEIDYAFYVSLSVF
mmetsp:Transcript_164060/g.526089  ORF Transcript_164060/g.526089 Transcript_164060/m.526089 type:complete len:214 (-) Transcript_164060:401-1042(-)